MNNSDFIAIYDRYSDKIFRHLYFRIRDRELALDLMQETFMKTFVYTQEKGSIESIQAFLYRVANNLMFDHFKKKKTDSLEKMQEETGFTPSIDPSEKVKAKIDADTLLDMMGKIPEEYQGVIVMRYVDELSITEIADVLGETENAVSVKIHRAIHKIRKFFPL